MESNPAQPPVDLAGSRGFVERILRRGGEQPVKWMLLLWLILFISWLMLGLVGLSFDKRPDVAVPPEAVPYASYLPGGNLSSTHIEIDPTILPVFDPTLLDRDIHSYQVWAPHPSNAPRLILALGTQECTFGWPTPWFGWGSFAHWDVTNLSEPFQRWVCEWEFLAPTFTWQEPATWFFKAADGTRYTAIWLDHGHLLIVLCGLQLISAGSVGMVWMSFAIRQRRRRRSRRCLMCGHNLGPIHSERPCPECGVASTDGCCRLPSRSALQRVFGGTGNALAVMLPFVFACWLLSTLLTATSESYEPIEDRLSRETVEIQTRNASPTGGLMTRETNIGWPVQVLSLWDSMHYQWTPAGGMQIVPAKYPPVFFGVTTELFNSRGPRATGSRNAT
jgi:hypothetical protein